jgi:hypothetical protein
MSLWLREILRNHSVSGMVPASLTVLTNTDHLQDTAKNLQISILFLRSFLKDAPYTGGEASVREYPQKWGFE